MISDVTIIALLFLIWIQLGEIYCELRKRR